MDLNKQKYQGLVADLLPNIRWMQGCGHFLFKFTNGPVLIRKIYAIVHYILCLLQFLFIIVNMVQNMANSDELTANTVTTLFFVHCLVKLTFFAFTSDNFYRTFNIWNQANAHPLFAESDARYRALTLAKMRKLLMLTLGFTFFVVTAWVTITFFGESVKLINDPETNGTMTEVIPRLPIKSFYPWNSFKAPMYHVAFLYQVYYLIFSLLQANLTDLLFCSFLLFACEQLQHLKGIMKPLMELSSTLDTYRPNSAALFRSISAGSTKDLINNEEKDPDMDVSGVYSSKADWGTQFRAPTTALQNFGANPNNLSRKQEAMVRSAIKYWVERHKHVVRLVAAIGDTYGVALLLHMLVSTINLTLLAYQATKIDGVNVYAFSTIGYLLYALGQVFFFCIYGNRLIEESSSVMEAAYSCHWYDGSEEAKTFVQIVCQQCQKAMTISGAKFFTVSLDLFASVLGAVVTYFMVLVQLN